MKTTKGRPMKTWTNKPLGKRTERRVRAALAALGTKEGAKKTNGLGLTAELLIGEHLAHLAAWSDSDEEKAQESIDALLAHVEELAAGIAKWAMDASKPAPKVAPKKKARR